MTPCYSTVHCLTTVPSSDGHDAELSNFSVPTIDSSYNINNTGYMSTGRSKINCNYACNDKRKDHHYNNNHIYIKNRKCLEIN